MVNLTEKQILDLREKRYHEKEVQEAYLESDRTDAEKVKYLKGVLNGTGLYWKVFRRLQKKLDVLSPLRNSVSF